MSVNTPATIWAPASGNGELTPSTSAIIDTESSLDLITESGVSLIIEASSFTQIPATVYIENESL